MKRFLLNIGLLFSTLTICSQNEIVVVEFNQSTKDISARTNRRDDVNGTPCALLKIQFPLRGTQFIGDIIGTTSFKTNEYWVYMPQNANSLEVRHSDFKPLVINFAEYGIKSVESNCTYDICLLAKEKDAPQLYYDGMMALGKNDIIIAFDKLTKAADAGYAPAFYELGISGITTYDEVFDEDPNTSDMYQEAYNCFSKASEKGHAPSQFALAKLLVDYKNGNKEELGKIKIAPDLLNDDKIKALFKSSADQGYTDAQWIMIADEKWCKENAEKGNAIAEFGMGFRYDESLGEEYAKIPENMNQDNTKEGGVDNYNIAFNWYQKSAEHGLDVAQWRVSDMYAQGKGVEKDINKAVHWRIKAAEQGNAIFEYLVAIMYSGGQLSDYSTYMYPDGYHFSEEIQKSVEKADFWLRKFNHHQLSKSEMDQVESNGLYSFTLDLLSEEFIKEKKYEKAIYWYQRQCEMGYRDAYCKLGEMYYKGWGVPEDYVKARELFEKADMDDEHYGNGYSGSLRDRAKAYIGVIYRDGLGVESDIMKAKTYLMDSAGNNDAKGMYEYAILLEREGNSETASKLFRELKNGWGSNDKDNYYKNKANMRP